MTRIQDPTLRYTIIIIIYTTILLLLFIYFYLFIYLFNLWIPQVGCFP